MQSLNLKQAQYVLNEWMKDVVSWATASRTEIDFSNNCMLYGIMG